MKSPRLLIIARCLTTIMLGCFALHGTPKAAATVKVQGVVVYSNVNTNPETAISAAAASIFLRGLSNGAPVAHVRVELWSGSGITAVRVDEGGTEADGSFTLETDSTHATPNTLRVQALNDYVNVKESKLVPLATDNAIGVDFNIPNSAYEKGGDVNLGNLGVDDDTDLFSTTGGTFPISRALFIATSVHRAGRHMEELSGETLSLIWVRLGYYASGAWYDITSVVFPNTIHLRGWDAATIDHEYGHHLENSLGAFGIIPSYIPFPWSHAGCDELTTDCWPFLEGLASWYGAVNSQGFASVSGLNFFGDPEDTSYLRALGDNYWVESGLCTRSWSKPESVESVVAQVLWDLIDNQTDTLDRVGSGVPEIAEIDVRDVLEVVMTSRLIPTLPCWPTQPYFHPVTLEQFAETYLDLHADEAIHPDIYAAFAFNGIAGLGGVTDVASPTAVSISSSSHTEGAWTNRNTIDLTVTDGADDFTGSFYYWHLWDTQPTTAIGAATIGTEDFQAKATVYATSQTLLEGDDQYLHVQTRDLAGHLGTTAHLGPIRIDLTKPDWLSMNFPAADQPYLIGTYLRFEWEATDNLSGVNYIYIAYNDPANGRELVLPTKIYSVSGSYEFYLDPDYIVPTTSGNFSVILTDHAGNKRTEITANLTIVSPFDGPHDLGLALDEGRVVSGDLNGDGTDEIVISGMLGGVRILRTIQMYPAMVTQDLLPGVVGGDLFLADIDRDGDLDIVAAGDFGGGGPEVYTFANNGAGMFMSLGALPITGTSDMVLRVVDLYGTGEPILVFGGRLGTGAPSDALRAYNLVTATLATLTGTHFRGGDFEVGDINADGIFDFVTLSYDSAGSGSIQLYVGSKEQNQFSWSTGLGTATIYPEIGDVDLGNWDFDNDLEFFAMYQTTIPTGAENHTELYAWIGAGFDLAIAGGGLNRIAEGDGHVVDIYNDGMSDVFALGRESGGGLSSWYVTHERLGRKGTGVPSPVREHLLYNTDTAWGDFDNDGDLDVVVAGAATGGSRRTLWYENKVNFYARPNSTPAAPVNLLSAYDAARGGYVLSWEAPGINTDGTVEEAFEYEIRVGSVAGASDIVTWAHPAGHGQQVAPQSVGGRFERLVSIPMLPGGIDWCVRTVDNGWRRSGCLVAGAGAFTDGLPVDTIATGTTPPYVSGGVLHLTDAINDQANYWITPTPLRTIQSVFARWQTLIGGGGDPNDGNTGADGLSFNLGTDLGTSFIAEEGSANGLSVMVDTFDNNGGEVGLEIKWNGVRLAFTRSGDGANSASAKAPLRRNAFVDTSLEITPTGLVTFTYAALSVTAQLPDYAGITVDQYVFAARTGAAHDNHWIDDLSVHLGEAPGVDLSVTLSALPTLITENVSFGVTVTASNTGPSVATSVQLTTTLPAGLTIQSVSSGQGSCSVLESLVVCSFSSIAPGHNASVELGLSAAPLTSPASEFENLSDLTCVVRSTESDLISTNNQVAAPLVVYTQRDFADAPDASVAASYAYPTLLADNGARHRMVGPYWGESAPASDRDGEVDGIPSLNADGDDVTDGNNDEAGVKFLDPVVAGATALRVKINAPLGGVVDGWFDFNRDGHWLLAPSEEQIFSGLTVPAGVSVHTISVPADAALGQTCARFRISSVGGLSFTGYAPDGEVNDARIEIMPGVDLVLSGPESIAVTERDVFGITLTVSNLGPSTADSAQLTATIPAGLTVQSAVAAQGSCTVQASNVVCTLTNLAPSGTALVQLGLYAEPLTAGSALLDLDDLSFLVSSPAIDLNGTNNLILVPAIIRAMANPPTVVLTRPTSGSSFAVGTPITLTATASAESGRVITVVQFLDGSNVLGQASSPPYTLMLPKLLPGIHALSARATDSVGLSAISEVAAVLVTATLTNPPGAVDLAFDPGSSISGENFGVVSIARQLDGKIVVGGEFTAVHGVARGRIARLHRDGSTDFTFGHGLAGADNRVNAVVLQPDGKVLIGGYFLQVNGLARNKIARLNPDGSLDGTFGGSVTGSSLPEVRTIAVQPDGKILIAGEFSFVNGVGRTDVARLESDGSLDLTFQNPAVNGTIFSMGVQPDGKIVIGGDFNSVGGVGRGRIARLNSDGSHDASFQNQLIGADNTINAVVVQSDGRVLIGGGFSTVNGAERRMVARLHDDGSIDESFVNPGLNPRVSSLALQSDGKIVAGGTFSYYETNLVGHGGITRLNSDGTRDAAFGTGLSAANNGVDSLLLLPTGEVLIGGRFTKVNDRPRVRIAQLNANGSLDHNFGNGPPGPDQIVHALAVQANDAVVIGGAFDFVNYGIRNGIARLHRDGSLDTNFQHNLSGVDAVVFSVALQSNQKILIGGNFGLVNGVQRVGVARLETDGRLDTTFQNTAANGQVLCVATQPDGKIIVAGGFNSIQGNVRSRIARLEANGALDPTFGNGGLNGQIHAVALQPDGKIVVGGSFTPVGGGGRTRIARLNNDGSLDPSFGAGLSGANGQVSAVSVLPDGKVLIAGQFSLVNGVSRNRIARLNADGSTDLAFLNNLTGVDGQIISLAVQPDNRIVIGGLFGRVNGVVRRHVARLHADGALDVDFLHAASGGNGGVFTVALARDGGILLGGDFTQINDLARDRVARLFDEMLIRETTSSPVEFSGIGHVSLGNATVSVTSNGLQVLNIGASGGDGVGVGLQELVRTARIQFTPVNLSGSGAGLTFATYGMVNDIPETFLGRLRLRNNNGGTELVFESGAAPVALWLQMEVYNQGNLAGTAVVPANGVLGTLSGSGQLAALTTGDANPNASRWILWELDFTTLMSFSSPSLTGDRVRLVALNPSGVLQNLMQLEVAGSNLDSIIIQEETAPIFQPQLRVTTAGQSLLLKWDTRNGVLQTAPTPTGPWTSVRQRTNSAEFPLTADSAFFRVEAAASLACLQPGYVCKRNVLLIIADDLGTDQVQNYINYYGDPDIPSANRVRANLTRMDTINKLARAGVTFLNAWSSPVCSPTRACLFTGTHSYRHGVYTTSPTGAELPGDSTTIANVLRNSGYATGLFGKWHLGEDPAYRPLQFGWERFQGSLKGEVEGYYEWDKADYSLGTIMGSGGLGGIAYVGDVHENFTTYATWENRDNALAWIGTRTGPWMATVAFNAPHWSGSPAMREYEMPPDGCAYQTRVDDGDRETFRSTIECLDRSIGDLLAGISDSVLENTTIIFMGDNGTEEQMSQHFTNLFPAGGHSKGTLYEGGINVPLIIADGYSYVHQFEESPSSHGIGRVVDPGRIETNVVQTLDLFATMAIIGRGDRSCGVDSVSLLPYLASNTASPQRDITFAETYEGGVWDIAVRDNTHKLIVRNYDCASNSSLTGEYELFDLVLDRWETSPILEDGTSTVAASLLAKLSALLAVPSACSVTPLAAVPTACP